MMKRETFQASGPNGIVRIIKTVEQIPYGDMSETKYKDGTQRLELPSGELLDICEDGTFISRESRQKYVRNA